MTERKLSNPYFIVKSTRFMLLLESELHLHKTTVLEKTATVINNLGKKKELFFNENDKLYFRLCIKNA